MRGKPDEVFPRLFKEWNVELLTFESDIEPYAIKRDDKIQKFAKESGVKVITECSHTIYSPEQVLKKNLGKPPLTYQKFLGLAESLPTAALASDPRKLDDKSKPSKDQHEKANLKCYDPPALTEMGVDESKLTPTKFPGGESEALGRMERHLKQTKWICSFEKPNTSPNSLEPSTTVLSPYLKFGCLSSRLFYKRLKEILSKNHPHSKPPTSLVGQLMWREFYYAVGAAVPNYDKMEGNSICQQVPWDTNKKFLDAWTHGRTGYPFIDAIMRQLRQEGWIHHLARHAVACFLTRGDLWISWEEGQKVFEELLLDADWALNAGNWMWLSASAFFHQFFRVYSPVAFGKKTDPEGKFIKKYCPELKKYPSGIIYEPWKASLKVQQEYGCVIGKDYPARIIVHEDVYKINISRMAAAYKRNKLAKAESDETVGTSSPVKSGKRKVSESTPKASSSKKAKTTSTLDNFVTKKKK